MSKFKSELLGNVAAHLKITGRVHFELRDEGGNLKLEQETDNLVVTAGKTHIASRMGGTSSAVMSHMAVGTTNTAAAAGDTTLAAEVGSSRTALTSYNPSTNTIVAICTFGAGVGTGALVEAGLFNASSAGTMLCRTVFSTINKAAGDSLTITWTITIS
jgi:hypothetical protein